MMELPDPSFASALRRLGLTGALFVAFTATAQAQPETSETPELAPGEDESLDRKEAASFKVENTLDQREFDRSAEADKKRDESIELLKKLIPQAPADRKAEMIFRLAELYWEKSRSAYRNEMDSFEKDYQAWAESGQTGKPPQQDQYVRQSELIKQNALKLYERVLAEYPRYERNAEVLFYLGYNEYEDDNKKKAIQHYLQLIKQFPQDPLVYDAHLQLGEHYFGVNDLPKAQRHYAEAVKAVDVPRIHNYSLYKLAWCDYNYQEFSAGIKKMKSVIDKSDAEGGKKSVQLRSEALKDLALFFSQVDEVDGAFAYFKAKGGEQIALRYTESLGNLLGEQGKWPLQIDAFRLLIDKYPMSDRAPHLQSKIVEAYSQLNEKEEVRREVERLVDLYRPGTPWYRHHEAQGTKGKAALEYAYDLTETSLRNLVTEYHRDAQKRKDVETYELARDIYAKYLDAFSETETSYEMRWFYADVLWALDEWKNAALQYDQLAQSEPTKDKAKETIRKESAYNQILAYEQIIKTGKEAGDPRTKKKIIEKKDKGKADTTITRVRPKLEEGKEYKEEPIPEVEQELSRACDLYFSIADDTDKTLPSIKFKAAYIYFQHNHFVEAAKRYFEIIERWPRDTLSKKSANLVMDSLFLQAKWDELAYYAGAFKGNSKLVGSDTKFAAEAQKLLEQATYKGIQRDEKLAAAVSDDVEKEAAYGAIAARFAKFQSDFPKSTFADEATFSAVLIYNNADQLDHAIEMAEIYRKEYEPKFTKKSSSKSKYRRKSSSSAAAKPDKNLEIVQRNHLLLAEFYERIADFDTSAGLYEEFYDSYPKHEKAPDTLYNAAIYRQGLGKTDEAIAQFTTYYTKHAENSEEAATVYWRVCGLHEFKQDWKEASKCYDLFRKKYKDASKGRIFESRYKVALMQEKLGKKSEAMKEYRWIVTEYPKLTEEERKDEGAQLAGAHAKFELLDVEYKAFQKIKITKLSKKQLNTLLNTAQELACVSTDDAKCKSEGKFLEVLTYGNGDYGICALTRMGQVFRHVATSLREAPIPRRLTIDQQEIYRAELESLAIGPELKGVEALERALDKAYELNIYNECTLTAQDNLRELNPNDFPDLQKPGFRGAEVFMMSQKKSDELVPDDVIEEVIEPATGTGSPEQAQRAP